MIILYAKEHSIRSNSNLLCSIHTYASGFKHYSAFQNVSESTALQLNAPHLNCDEVWTRSNDESALCISNRKLDEHELQNIGNAGIMNIVSWIACGPNTYIATVYKDTFLASCDVQILVKFDRVVKPVLTEFGEDDVFVYALPVTAFLFGDSDKATEIISRVKQLQPVGDVNTINTQEMTLCLRTPLDTFGRLFETNRVESDGDGDDMCRRLQEKQGKLDLPKEVTDKKKVTKKKNRFDSDSDSDGDAEDMRRRLREKQRKSVIPKVTANATRPQPPPMMSASEQPRKVVIRRPPKPQEQALFARGKKTTLGGGRRKKPKFRMGPA